MLPNHGPPGGPPSTHVELWYDAADTNIKAGHDSEAAAFLERLQAGYEWQYAPEPWARSFFLLGQIYERRGDATKSREQYAQFLELWRNGDMERSWVAQAASVATSPSR